MTRFAVATFLLALAFVLSMPARAQSFEPFVASDIRVDGLQRITSGTVFTYLPIERGDRIDRDRLAESIRALFATGFFTDVTMTRQGDILVITVQERPAVNSITLVGNKDLKTEDLMKGLKEIGLAEGETFNRLQLDRITQELTRQYNNRGKYNVRISPTVSDLDRNRVDVTITIAEGKASRIRHINLVGNETFPDKDLLKEWESGTTNWKSWYSRNDQYSREKLTGDLERLNSYYLDRGYVDFNIESTQVAISPDKRDVYVVAGMVEGEIYSVSSVQVTGDTVIPREEMEKMLLVRSEQTFSRRLLELTSDSMTSVLGNIGHAFAEVTPIPTVDREGRTVAINFFVEPGPRVYVRRIQFKGNTRTSDEVLRRELRQYEGMWYSQAALDRSKIRLDRLGFFEDINFETIEVAGSPDQVDVEISVGERSSGSFIFGLGYSQLAGVITSVSVVQNNFFGTGNRVGVTVQNNSFSKRLDFSYSDPYFTQDGVSVGYNIYYRELDQQNFNVARFTSDSGAIQAVFGIPLSETDGFTTTFSLDRNQIFEIRGSTAQPIVDYIDALGQRTFNAWRTEFAWARDSRNAFFNPTRGTYQRLGAEITLPGSTVEYYKLNYQFARYWPINRALILLTSAELGYGAGYGKSRELGMPFFENFYAGGVNSIRTFEDNTLGPIGYGSIDTQLANPQPLGGTVKTTGSVELIFPTLFENTDTVRLSAFFDFGNVFADADSFDVNEFRASAGVAVRWQAPVGPIILNLGVPLRSEDDDRIERLQFSFGTQF